MMHTQKYDPKIISKNRKQTAKKTNELRENFEKTVEELASIREVLYGFVMQIQRSDEDMRKENIGFLENAIQNIDPCDPELKVLERDLEFERGRKSILEVLGMEIEYKEVSKGYSVLGKKIPLDILKECNTELLEKSRERIKKMHLAQEIKKKWDTIVSKEVIDNSKVISFLQDTGMEISRKNTIPVEENSEFINALKDYIDAFLIDCEKNVEEWESIQERNECICKLEKIIRRVEADANKFFYFGSGKLNVENVEFAIKGLEEMWGSECEIVEQEAIEEVINRLKNLGSERFVIDKDASDIDLIGLYCGIITQIKIRDTVKNFIESFPLEPEELKLPFSEVCELLEINPNKITDSEKNRLDSRKMTETEFYTMFNRLEKEKNRKMVQPHSFVFQAVENEIRDFVLDMENKDIDVFETVRKINAPRDFFVLLQCLQEDICRNKVFTVMYFLRKRYYKIKLLKYQEISDVLNSKERQILKMSEFRQELVNAHRQTIEKRQKLATEIGKKLNVSYNVAASIVTTTDSDLKAEDINEKLIENYIDIIAKHEKHLPEKGVDIILDLLAEIDPEKLIEKSYETEEIIGDQQKQMFEIDFETAEYLESKRVDPQLVQDILWFGFSENKGYWACGEHYTQREYVVSNTMRRTSASNGKEIRATISFLIANNLVISDKNDEVISINLNNKYKGRKVQIHPELEHLQQELRRAMLKYKMKHSL